jgi:membrane fusion protein, heavy metal efflux system
MTSNPLRTLLAASAVLALAACGNDPPPAPTIAAPVIQGNTVRLPANHPQLALLTVKPVVAESTITVELPAKLVWNEDRTQRIYPAFAGRVLKVEADLGSTVSPGSALAQLASPDFGQAQADAQRAQIDASASEKSRNRVKELFDAGILPRKELDAAEADLARARTEQDRARARTALYGSTGGVNQQMSLRASIAGLVVERNLNPGQELRPDQSGPGMPAAFVVSDPSSLWVQIDAREADIGLLRTGANFSLAVSALPDRRFEGKVVAASDFIDPASRIFKVRGLVANPQRLLKAEMLGTARFTVQRASAVPTVPAAAAVLQSGKFVVMVEREPGVFEQRRVEVMPEHLGKVEVRSGLSPGERVVVDGALLLTRAFGNVASAANATVPDQNVEPEMASPTPAKPPNAAAPSNPKTGTSTAGAKP